MARCEAIGCKSNVAGSLVLDARSHRLCRYHIGLADMLRGQGKSSGGIRRELGLIEGRVDYRNSGDRREKRIERRRRLRKEIGRYGGED